MNNPKGDIIRTIPMTEEQYRNWRNGLKFGEAMLGAVNALLESATEQRVAREEAIWAAVHEAAGVSNEAERTEVVHLDWVLKTIIVREA